MQTTLAVLCSLSEVRMLMVGEPSLPIRPAMSAPRPLVTGAMKQLRIMGLLCRRSKVVNIPIQFKTQNKTRGQTFTTLRFRSHTAAMCNVTLITSPWFVGSTKALILQIVSQPTCAMQQRQQQRAASLGTSLID